MQRRLGTFCEISVMVTCCVTDTPRSFCESTDDDL